MVTDKDTNQVYVSDLLKTQFHSVYEELDELCIKYNIPLKTINKTKNIWCRDFMPVQISKDKYVKFKYEPTYLMRYKKDRDTITDPTTFLKSANINYTTNEIPLDGGNVVKDKDRVIITDRIFEKTPETNNGCFNYDSDLVNKIQEEMDVDHIIIIPENEHDIFGHSDGMIRFIDDDTVLINKYAPKEETEFFTIDLKSSLNNAKLAWFELPYNPYGNKGEMDATGIYINYLQTSKFIAMPIFGMDEDEDAYFMLKGLFDVPIETIDCEELAKEGGLLNCITWNVYA